jgi:hypothetical protein
MRATLAYLLAFALGACTSQAERDRRDAASSATAFPAFSTKHLRLATAMLPRRRFTKALISISGHVLAKLKTTVPCRARRSERRVTMGSAAWGL